MEGVFKLGFSARSSAEQLNILDIIKSCAGFRTERVSAEVSLLLAAEKNRKFETIINVSAGLYIISSS